MAGTAKYRFSVHNTWQDWVSVPDDGSGTAFPLDGAGLAIPGTLGYGQQIQVVFRAVIATYQNLTPGTSAITNTGSVEITPLGLNIALNWTDPLYGSIGDRVWIDTNANGVQDSGEVGLNGVVVYADLNNNGVWDAGEPKSTTVGDGSYVLTGLSAGTCTVRVDPASVAALDPKYGPTYDLDGIATSYVATVTLAAAQNRTDVDFGLRAVCSVGDRVWVDRNGNGVQESGEPGINGVRVYIDSNSNGTYDAGEPNSITFGDGTYYVGNLQPGTYRVRIDTTTLPTGATQTFDLDGLATANQASVTLTNGQHNPNLDFGYRGTQSIGDLVWEDFNANAAKDTTETGLANVRVYIDANGNGMWDSTEAFAITNASGIYSIGNLFNGTYRVRVDTSTLPASMFQTYDLTSPTTDNQASVVLSGTSRTDVDFGYRYDATIGDRVWNDLNNNGVQDAGEPGIPGVIVFIDANANSIFDSATERYAVTDESGYYVLNNLAAGTYSVRVELSTLPQGSTQTFDLDGTGTANVANRTVTANQDATDVDFGYRSTASVGDFVWTDTNGNGVQDAGETGISGVRVYLDMNGNGVFDSATEPSAITPSSGAYLISGLVAGTYTARVDTSTLPAGVVQTYDLAGPLDNAATFSISPGQARTDIDFGYVQPTAIGDQVWLDVNANGVQDAGETGIDGVGVTLFNATYNTVAGTTTTAGGGLYSFTHLMPGTYYVKFAALPGYGRTFANVGSDDTKDSDAIASTGVTGNYVLAAGTTNHTVDAGYFQEVTIGDFVWSDANANGLQDSGETGLAGVLVSVYRPGYGPDGIPGTADDSTAVASMTTPASGAYSFTGLPAGTYQVGFGTLAGYGRTLADLGADDTKDSDADASTGLTATFTLAAGSSNNTIDAGYYQTATIGDFVWSDVNANGVQDSGEPGIAGVVVTAYRPGYGPDGIAGTTDDALAVATTTSNSSGAYSITGLPPGTYQVGFGMPTGYGRTTAHQGADDTKDSDASASTGLTGSFVLAAGATNVTIDAGYQALSIGDYVWTDRNANGIQDAGETGIAGVQVQVYTSGGVAYQSRQTLGTFVDDFNAAGGANGGSGLTGSDGTLVWTPAWTATGTGAVVVNVEPDWEMRVGDGVGSLTRSFVVPADTAQITISYDYRTGAGNDTVLAQWSADGSTWNTLASYNMTTSGSGSASWPVATTAGTRYIRFTKAATTNAGGNQEYMYFDNVSIVAQTALANVAATTDANGFYYFGASAGLVGGTSYQLRVATSQTPLTGLVLTAQNQGTNDALDSDATLATASGFATIGFTAPSSGADQTLDFGFMGTSSLGDRVWNDINANGLQDAGETGIDGVIVTLYNAADNSVERTTTTAGGGLYSFNNLLAGTYYAVFGTVAGYNRTLADQGADDTKDSDANASTGLTGNYVLTSGTVNNSIDAGYYHIVALSGNVYDDANGLTDNTVNGTGTNAGGRLFANLIDGSNKLAQAVAVAAGGSYSFGNVMPNTSYTVVLSTTQGTVGATAPAAALPAGYVNTGEHLGADTGSDGTVDGVLAVAVTTSSVTNANFGIEQPPTANNVTASSQLNPGGPNRVVVPTLNGTDPEDTSLTTFSIKTLPGSGTVYYNGTAVTPGQVITSYSPSLLTVDPNDGTVTVSFTYSVTDAAGRESSPATVTMPFTAIGIAGNIYDDANGLTDNTVNGTGTNAGGKLYANLVSGGNVVQAVAVAANGTYVFGTVAPNTSYSVVLSTTQGTVGGTAPAAALPSGWVNTGEHLGAGAGSDGTVDGVLAVAVTTSSVTNANFGIEQPPTANNVTASSQLNPGGTNRVVVPTLNGTDPEDTSLTTFSIKTLPGSGTVYYNGTAVTPGQVITSYSPSLLTVDPNDGTVTVSFTYSVTDAAGRESSPATVTMPFTAINLSGNVYDDANGLTDGTVNGTGTNAGGRLFANLIDGSNKVAQAVAVAAGGSYSFGNVVPNTSYTVVLSTTQGTAGATAPAAALPSGWVNTGEHLGTGTGSDGTIDGVLAVAVTTSSVTNANFGIEQPPTANNVTAASQLNPGGTNRVVVPTLNGTDPEDASLTTFTIKTLPGNGSLYYNGTAVTLGQVITSYSPSLLTVDPNDGTVTVSFTYSVTDAAGKESSPATVTLPFTAIGIAGNVYDDANGLSGTPVNTVDGTGTNAGGKLYANLVSGGNVVQAVAVAANGTYVFGTVAPNTSYTVVLSTTQGTAGATAPAAALPSGWVNTGEHLGAGTGSDGTPDGILAVTVTTASITDANFGIHPAAISGYVLAGSRPLAGVTLTLHDASGNPVDGDPNTPGVQPVTAVTDANGFYLFRGVAPGSYQVWQTQPAGYGSFGDRDGGNLNIIGDKSLVVAQAGQTNADNTFLETSNCPSDWATWISQRPGQGAADNPDGDAYDNLAEYAFAMPSDSGAGNAWSIQPGVGGTLEGVFARPLGATANVTYSLQYAADLGSPPAWQTLDIATLIAQGKASTATNGCTETVTLLDLENLTGLAGGKGVVRLKADLYENPPSVIDHTSYTEVEGWKDTTLPASCRTYNNPFLRETVFTGTVGAVNGQNVSFATSAGSVDLSTLLTTGAPYYLEVTSGANEGHRFDVVSAGGSAITLANDANLHAAGAPFNTLTGAPPATLVGNTVVLRRHWTLREVFPPEGFVASASQSSADEVQVFAGGAWTVYWLYNGDNPTRWVDAADVAMDDKGAAVIPPGQGLFINKRTAQTPQSALLAYGEVRANAFIRPLAPAYNFVGGGYPLDQSATGPAGRAMNLAVAPASGFFGSRDFKTADTFSVWKADATIGAVGYTGYYLLNGAPISSLVRWVKVGDTSAASQGNNLLLLGNRAVFIVSASGLPAYLAPRPWTP